MKSTLTPTAEKTTPSFSMRCSHGCDHHSPHSHDENHPQSWLAKHLELVLSLLCGLFLLIGYVLESLRPQLHHVSLAFYVASYLSGGWQLARHTFPTVLRGQFDVDFLMLLGAVGAALLGNWPEGAFLLFLFSLGHSLEHLAMDRARNAISALGKLTPKTARVRREGIERELSVHDIGIGDIAIVRPGDRVAVDGCIIEGHSSLDQSPITGESVPVEKGRGELVFAGSINGDGALEVEVTKLAHDTTMARVIKMVEEAQAEKSPTQTLTDRIERIFVPLILSVVVFTALVPPLLGWLSWETAFLRALSTLIAASPCALALATPSAVLAGIAQAARNGVLIKGGKHLENLASVRAIAFDKTGTITRGRPEVTDVLAHNVSELELMSMAAAVETRSSHPLAQAIVRYAQEHSLLLPVADELQMFGGRGVQGEIDGQTVRIGNARWFEENNIAVPHILQEQLQLWHQMGKPTMLVARDQEVVGAIALADGLRQEAVAAFGRLRAMGVPSLIMLTGDNLQVAQRIADSAGLTEVRANLLPEDKVQAIQLLRQQHGTVAMTGDGVNDAPALANATVGIAMGASGTDVALETADVALMGDDLSKLPFAVALSRQAHAIILQNLCISLGVIALLVPAALFGWARLGVAVIFHEGSTVIVVLNALRLLRFSPPAK